MTTKEEYRARKSAEEAKYKNKFLERNLGWWRNPPDRFAALVAIFTAGLFFVTLRLWLATTDLVNGADINAKQQLRAYVFFDATRVEISDTELTMYVDNFGQTPATDVAIFSSWEFVKYGEDLPDNFQFLVKPPCGNSPPNQKMLPGPLTIFPKDTYPSHYFNCPAEIFDVSRARNKQLNAFMYGFIRYMDIFNEPHRTNFCFLYVPTTGTSLFCNRHNELDPKQHYQ